LTVQSAIDTYAFNIRDTIGNERVLIGSRATAPVDNITPVQMGNDNTGNLFLSSRTNSASGINFYTNAGTAASLRATLDSSGNLGIGTSSPGSKVSVNDPGTGQTFSNAGGGNFNIGLLAGTGSALAYVFNRANSDLLFGTNNAETMRLTSGGNLGIGTSSPTAVLDVNADKMRLRTAKTPSSATDTGNAGDICWDSSYLYICTATNTWRRIAHASW
jgi:hypothetical protein